MKQVIDFNKKLFLNRALMPVVHVNSEIAVERVQVMNLGVKKFRYLIEKWWHINDFQIFKLE